MSRRNGNPWFRMDVQTYADAKVRIGRCGAVWPWCLATLKRCGGSATDEDLDPMLAAADLCIPPELAAEQIAGAKRVGLLIDDDGEWTTANWAEYQPDPRKRADRRKPRSSQADPVGPREHPHGPREHPHGPDRSHFDPCYGTGRDGTGRDGTGRDTTSDPSVGGRSRARDGSAVGNDSTPSGAGAPPPTPQGKGHPVSIAKGSIPGDVINRWAALMDAGGAPLRPALEEHLRQAWQRFDGDVIRLALAELESAKIEKHGRCPKPMWLVERCTRIAGERSMATQGGGWDTFDPAAWKAREAELAAEEAAKWARLAAEHNSGRFHGQGFDLDGLEDDL